MGEETPYLDKNGIRVMVGDWIEFLWWIPCSNGLQREMYYYGRILKRKGHLIFKYRERYYKGAGYIERRLNTLNFDSESEWRIVNGDIEHYGGRMPANALREVISGAE